nr:hypothetical protein [uncultured Draconibacterium sp.]
MINWVSILIPFFIGIYRYRQFNKNLRFVFYFVIFGTITEIVTRIIIYSGATNTLPVTHIYLMIEFLILGLFYTHVLQDIIRKRVMLGIIILFEIYCLINTLFLQSIFEYPSIPQSVSKLLLVGFSILFFYKIMIETSVPNLWKEPLIFINIAILVYYSGNLFYSLLFNLILEYSREFSKITQYYFAGLMTLFYILIAIGFWKANKQMKQL